MSAPFLARLLALPVAAAFATLCVSESAVAKPRARPTPVRAPHTIYEHQDHRMLPIGTKIYFAGDGNRGGMTYVYPGAPVPRAFAGRAADVVVVSPYDPRADDVRERTKPAQACCGAHLLDR